MIAQLKSSKGVKFLIQCRGQFLIQYRGQSMAGKSWTWLHTVSLHNMVVLYIHHNLGYSRTNGWRHLHQYRVQGNYPSKFGNKRIVVGKSENDWNSLVLEGVGMTGRQKTPVTEWPEAAGGMHTALWQLWPNLTSCAQPSGGCRNVYAWENPGSFNCYL